MQVDLIFGEFPITIINVKSSFMKFVAALLVVLPVCIGCTSGTVSASAATLTEQSLIPLLSQGEQVKAALVLAVSTDQYLPAPPEVKTVLRCDDNTEDFFNRSGIEVFPFVRPAFFDMDGDGVQEMILGTKDGSLVLYKNSGLTDIPRWGLVRNYFDGIKAGAFSSPAAGDIDGDGKPEILVGTGGFSTDSGKVIVYRNQGSDMWPVWKKIPVRGLKVGNEASPALVDLDQDGKLDLIVGDSSGSLFLFRNKTSRGRISFFRDTGYFRGLNLGLYAVPAAASSGTKTVIIAGNSMGKLYILKRLSGKKKSWHKEPMPIWISSFASPAFIQTDSREKKDLVVADGNGQVHYFKNKEGNYREWELTTTFVTGRMMPGPACSPAVTRINDRSYLVVGNLYGELRLYEYDPSSGDLPWTHRHGFFRGIQLPGFSRGVLTQWQNNYLLIAGHENGLTAFLNTGTMEKPEWVEKKDFFKAIPKILHAAPAIYDVDGDGTWELMVGDAKGNVHGFRYTSEKDGGTYWEKISDCFSEVKVDRFATPAFIKDADMLYLLVGQQDGRVRMFTTDVGLSGSPVFRDGGYIEGVQANTHSSPAVILNEGIIELSVGDYDGNLKHFTCKPAYGKLILDNK